MTALDYFIKSIFLILIGVVHTSASLNHESCPQGQVVLVQQICPSEFQLLAADNIQENKSGY